MAKLEDFTPGTLVDGIIEKAAVEVISTKWHGDSAAEITYKTPETGQTNSILLYRDDEYKFEITEEGRPWGFDADGSLFRLVSEAVRIRLAYLFDPLLAVHTSLVEPLPHQITAVYEEMLTRQPLRFLLADDPGAGKTIMAGLLIKELIARGDLGVEMAPEKIPSIQKNIIRKAREAGKPVVVATQMLESMINNQTPTRAEASDVATAIYDPGELESEYSNEVGSSPMDFVDITLSEIGTDVYASGDQFDVIVSMNNPTEIAGIQIVLQDVPESVTMVNVEGLGRLEGEDLNSFSADFNGEATILWFSFTGEVLEAGDGEIIQVTYQVNDDVDGGPCEISLNTTEAGTALSDSAGNAFFYNGDSTTTVNIAYDANLSLVQTSDTTFDVILLNTVDVAGIQVTIIDDPDNYTFSSVQGADRLPADWMVSGNENNGIVLLGFSFTGCLYSSK